MFVYFPFSLISVVSNHPRSTSKLITEDGGVIKVGDVILSIAAACLVKSTEITLIIDDQNMVFKSLLELGLVDAAPRVVECLPDGLKFFKPADLTFRYEKPISDSELFVLHGSTSDCDDQDIVWELMIDDIKDKKALQGLMKIKINGFCIYSLILAKRGWLARILCHLNHSFTCCAYAFYRRLSMDTIDISVVIMSDFVDERAIDEIRQLKNHYDEGYIKAEKGMDKCVNTECFLEISLDFPGLESTPFKFKIDQAELDKDGYVVDHFNGIVVNRPAKGKLRITELHESSENKELWTLNVREREEEASYEEEVSGIL